MNSYARVYRLTGGEWVPHGLDSWGVLKGAPGDEFGNPIALR